MRQPRGEKIVRHGRFAIRRPGNHDPPFHRLSRARADAKGHAKLSLPRPTHQHAAGAQRRYSMFSGRGMGGVGHDESRQRFAPTGRPQEGWPEGTPIGTPPALSKRSGTSLSTKPAMNPITRTPFQLTSAQFTAGPSPSVNFGTRPEESNNRSTLPETVPIARRSSPSDALLHRSVSRATVRERTARAMEKAAPTRPACPAISRSSPAAGRPVSRSLATSKIMRDKHQPAA